jgi:hypothetical protein
MSSLSGGKFSGYVKVEILTHHPRQWTWKVCKETNHAPVLVAKTPLSCAESAWSAGSKALKLYEHGCITEDSVRLDVTPAPSREKMVSRRARWSPPSATLAVDYLPVG